MLYCFTYVFVVVVLSSVKLCYARLNQSIKEVVNYLVNYVILCSVCKYGKETQAVSGRLCSFTTFTVICSTNARYVVYVILYFFIYRYKTL